jgi:hypothetical protein
MSKPAIEPDNAPAVTEDKQTIELCADEHRGHRCILRRGHEGRHECPTVTSSVTWPDVGA